jgi:excisionase family DNA binding protein
MTETTTEKLLTTKQLAQAIGASESSLRRWTDSGAIGTARTVGGHRRIPLTEAIRFIRDTKAAVLRPDLLGLDFEAGQTIVTGGEQAVAADIHQALTTGDTARAKAKAVAMYLSGFSLAGIFDHAIRPAMARIGELWQHSERGILVEHRATDLCIQTVSRLRDLVPAPPANAPNAVVAAPSDDPYILPSLMASIVLTEAGYHTTNLGPDTPLSIFLTAATEHHAALACLSVSAASSPSILQRDLDHLGQSLAAHNTRLLIGGRLGHEIKIREDANAHLLSSMTELAAFARGAK